ncbi:hypothetical protein BO94DRAFT_472039 [Aspergillus sclerotioniger CBS 115572]|uniref:Shelterin complex subunit TPP1/Est3 domain-containing protein n=1 Tax=Aspergillus sclerotioniger CBS 115572 TaxID=1450535 RepID=A0A317VYW6_9EURO|nr:hypothetical protein BO94DRAFT_472039 [Aspergillus sclerotioniger CBS 115572]PWY78521.1 hypothetical protein BO94DRAFT_472039 [Aspergillus sclerotioniger CBS 115572]
MGSTEIWITSALETCLSAYSRGLTDSYQCEDDGSNLRFSIPAQYSALIYNWSEQAKWPRLTLTDSKTQIEAILTKEALKEYKKTSPDHPLSGDVARGYYIQLLDFQVVLEYSTAEPKVHLYVQRFEIDWHRGKIKSAPQGRFVSKNQSVKRLMQHVFKKAKGPEPREVHSERFDDSFGSQAYQGTVSQDVLMSQIPSIAPATSPVARLSSISTSRIANKLLEDAGMRFTRSDDRSLKHVKKAAPESSNDKVHELGTKTAEKLRSRQHSAGITNAPDSITARRNSATSAREIPCSKKTRISEAPIPRLSTEREVPVEVVIKVPLVTESKQPVGDSNCVTTEDGTTYLPPQGIGSDKPSFGTTKPRENMRVNNTDPWHDMTRITIRDVQIPKEQAEFLEQHRRRWIPPSPGESTPQGHVPPRLLDQWNKIALRRSRIAQDKQSVDVAAEPLETSRPSPTPLLDSDSEGEPLTSQWSSSPEQVPRSRQVLPEDSSPVRVRSLRKGTELLDGKHAHPSDEQPPGRASLDTAYGNQTGPMPEDQEAHMGATSNRHDQLVNHDDASKLEGTTQIPGRQDESDAESDDSVMDTSVPCPLGGDIQQSQVTSQSEQEITSSGPSLPGASVRGHVQVVETPDSNHRRHRSPDIATKGPRIQAHPERTSSEAAKSSSQSRILNTNASSDSKGVSSQDMANAHRVDGGAVPHDIDIIGTQVSIGSLPTHDTTPYTTSDVVNSSASGVQEPSVSISVPGHQSQTSNQFSSYREMPSSIPSEAEEEAPVDTMQTSAKHPTIQPPKRRASEMGHEVLSPAKRPKVQRDRESTEKPVLNVFARRQSYIGHSAENLEAQKVYEKFRRDYPNYLGDFDHFVKVCSKLHAVRSKGHLQRSFLWDDFVIKNLEEYPRYLEKCLSADTKALLYEDFFTSSYSRPFHKKRSLTAHGINISAAQYVPDNQDHAPDTDALANKPDTSFTGSLVERFTNFRAHSFGPGTQGTQSDTDMDYMSCLMSSPTPQAKIKHARVEPGGIAVMKEPMDVDSKPESDSARQEIDPESDSQAVGKQPTTVEPEQPSASASASEIYYDVEDQAVDEPAMGEDAPSVQLEQHLQSTLEESELDLHMTGSQSHAVEVEQPRLGSAACEVDRAGSPAAHQSQAEDLDPCVPESQNEETYATGEQPMVDLESSIPESSSGNKFPSLYEQSRDIDLDSSIPEKSMIIRNSTEPDFETEFSDEEKTTAPELHLHPISLPPDSEAGSDYEDEDEDMNDETHETASIELGEDTQADAQPAPDTESDTESVNENWFLSLRHLRPTGPVWSDDPNTPFKQWARADQAVLSERNRRGGAYLPIDEKGVIQRPGYRDN